MTRLSAIAIVCCAFGLAPAAASAGPVVLSPRAGATVPSGPVKVRVRVPRGTRVSAAINGQATGDRFHRSRSGVSKLAVSPSHGVRFGSNVLRVRLRPRGRRRGGETRTVRFRVARDGPLAAAGRNRTVTLPSRIVLDGQSSLSHLDAGASAAARGRQHLGYSWRIVRAPRRSRLAKRTGRARSAGEVPLVARAADAGVDDADATVTTVDPDQPGRYEAELTVTAPDGTTDTDRVGKTVRMPRLLHVDTMARFTPKPVTAPASPPTDTTPTDTTPTTSTATTTTSTSTTSTSTTATSTTDQTSTTLTSEQPDTTTTATTTTDTTTTPTPAPPTNTQAPGGSPQDNPPCQLRSAATGIDTGTPGIQIGDLFCPDDPSQWLQVVVLDRQELTPMANKRFPCPQAMAGAHTGDVGKVSQCIKDVQDFLAPLNSRSLVIASSQPPNTDPPCVDCPEWNMQPIVGVAQALQRIGVSVPSWSNTGSAFLRGRFSAIGVPGYPAGSARVNARPNLSDTRFTGEISGSLIADNNLNFTFMPPRVTFDTQGVGSNATQNVVRVGDRTYTTPLDPNDKAQGGFQVVVVDRNGLGLDGSGQSSWFPTGQADFDSGEPGRLNAMASTLATANRGDNLVIVTSRGNPAAQRAGEPSQWSNVSDAAKNVVDQLEKLGATRTEAYRAIASPSANAGSPYTLIGWSGAGVAQGLETTGEAPVGKAALSTVPISGAFEPGQDYRYQLADSGPSPLTISNSSVVESDSVHRAGELLRDTLEQPAQPWPDNDTPNEAAAISYIEQKLFSDRDLRTDYWNKTQSDQQWSDARTSIGGLSYPGSTEFTKDDFAAAQKELQTEIGWVLNVRGFTSSLAKPFDDSALTNWAASNGIAATINGLVGPAPRNPTLLVAERILEGAAEIGAEALSFVPIVGEVAAAAVSSVNTVYHTVLEVTNIVAENQQSQKPVDVPFPVTASQVLSQMQSNLQTARDTLKTQFMWALVSDYGRLKAVGQCTGVVTSGCANSDAWTFDTGDEVAAKNALSVGGQIETYTALLPARWQLYQLGPSCPGSTNNTCWETDFQNDGFFAQAFLGHVCPFRNEPSSAKMIRPLRRSLPDFRNDAGHNNFAPVDEWQAYVLGNLQGLGVAGNVWRIEVPGDYLRGGGGVPGLFAPLDPSGDLSRGGLGASPEEVYMRAYNHPILVASKADGGEQPIPIPESDPKWATAPDTNCTATP